MMSSFCQRLDDDKQQLVGGGALVPAAATHQRDVGACHFRSALLRHLHRRRLGERARDLGGRAQQGDAQPHQRLHRQHGHLGRANVSLLRAADAHPRVHGHVGVRAGRLQALPHVSGITSLKIFRFLCISLL